MIDVRSGRCLCGAVKYQLTGKAAVPVFNTVCHCVNCRRATGSAFLAASICPRDGFVIDPSSLPHLRSYEDHDTRSSTSLCRQSCAICGSTLFALTPLWTEIVSVAAGTLDDFEQLDWKPDVEQFCGSRVTFLQPLCQGVVAEEKRFAAGVKV